MFKQQSGNTFSHHNTWVMLSSGGDGSTLSLRPSSPAEVREEGLYIGAYPSGNCGDDAIELEGTKDLLVR